ncbi:similar to Saccharomyces cerevisiae YHR117W TOM71 Mitochondrial outer membrane protein with similarity to Tom70p [Maudiozyma saulgeensis]|uniref:Similar to Saccharomyces cerevisiae YHR117W TOM71 Mitochondrial outer membrane protein with similarity to Tom70p n=1 Tax=Maudiozyma saulgeensis TaxID=1789683 RepID=A0A1X7R0F3_9SACH|nr:similar to Saccharomyces cerevisiae YHR117W TOM71 Mitochondrial outer membrane protein with similarity to Tom70p [Kazachstania saulgeensis]
MDGFVKRNRTAIVAAIATITAGSVAVGAYYYYKQLQDEVAAKSSSPESESITGTSSSKSKSSKKNKKKNKKKTKTHEYPILTNGEPDFEQIETFTSEKKDSIATALKDKGNEFFKAQNMQEALNYYNYALKMKQDPVYYSNISACYVSLNDQEKVIEFTTKALELRPDYSKALLRRASAYETLERFSDAMFDLSVLSLNNDYSGASIEPMLERNLNKQAMRVLKEKLNIPDNEDDETVTVTSGIAQQLPSDTALASFFGIFKPEVNFDNYDETNENDKSLKNGLTELYSATNVGYLNAEKNFDSAAKGFLEQYETDKTNDVIKRKLAISLEYVGIFKFLKNDLAGAQENIKRAIELHPRVNSYIYMALTMADKGDTQDYFTYFDKALELDPNCSATYYHRGQLYFITQKYDLARADFIKSKEVDENNIFPYIQLACLEYRESNFEGCKQQFDLARKKFPIAPEVPTFFAEILADKGDFDEARKQYEIARKLETQQPTIRVGIAPLVGKATVISRQPSIENFKEASKLFEEACELDPRSEQAKVGLAQLKLQEEDVDNAITLFEEAADLARTIEEKLQATTFAEAAKVQKRIRADPVVRAKVEEALAQYRAQGHM